MAENDPLASALAGMVGGTVGKLFCHPIDSVKARIQVKTEFGSAAKGSLLGTASEVVRLEGIQGLYRGLPINLFGSIPASFLFFGSYELFKHLTYQNTFIKENPEIAHLFGGLFAEAVACALFVPIDVIKERRQVQS